jgi:hypothetical protein
VKVGAAFAPFICLGCSSAESGLSRRPSPVARDCGAWARWATRLAAQSGERAGDQLCRRDFVDWVVSTNPPTGWSRDGRHSLLGLWIGLRIACRLKRTYELSDVDTGSSRVTVIVSTWPFLLHEQRCVVRVGRVGSRGRLFARIPTAGDTVLQSAKVFSSSCPLYARIDARLDPGCHV